MASTLLRIGLRNVNSILEKNIGVLSICINGVQSSSLSSLHVQNLVSFIKICIFHKFFILNLNFLYIYI